MDTSKLKPFAQDARRVLKAQVSARLDQVLAEQSAARREQPKAVSELEVEIAKSDRDQVIEKVAYTWFNRFTALRFMDANGYTRIKVVSPAEGQTRPEILAEAAAGNIDEDAPADVRNKVAALLDGRTPSRDPQGEAYRLLLVAACNQWHAAMPFMFEKIADYTELLMPEDLLSADSILAKARTVMTEDACQDVEIIGWLYQFYISEKKDQVFAGLKKNQKITAENIPAATQLFTPHWIVRYLVENSLGRLWLLNRPRSKLAERMDYYITPEESETDFLKISNPEEIKICDPACGSGHMLTYAFDLLYAIYEEEGYEADRIPALILQHNLTGVEIDDRAGALAAFALAMKAAARLGRRRFLRMEAKPDILVLQNVNFTPAELQDVATVVGRDMFTGELRETLLQFEQAKNFGSLIVPILRDPAETLRVVQTRDFGGDLLLKEVKERVVAVLRMAEALSPRYHVVVANPPYMGAKGGMNSSLVTWSREQYPESKADLYSMFIERNERLTKKGGIFSMITMQGWMFLSSFEKMRGGLLSRNRLISVAHLGPRAFDSIGGEVVSTAAFAFERQGIRSKPGTFLRLTSGRNESEKSEMIRDIISGKSAEDLFSAQTDAFDSLPGSPVAYWASEAVFDAFQAGIPIGEISAPRQGLATSDNERFLRLWHEVAVELTKYDALDASDAKKSRRKWFPYNKGGSFRKWYGNNENLINWENDGAEVIEYARSLYGSPTRTIKNIPFYFRDSITWSALSSDKIALRFNDPGFVFDTKGQCIFFDSEDEKLKVLAMLNSAVSNCFLSFLAPTLDYNSGVVAKVPFIDPHNGGDSTKQCVRIAKSDWDAFETSWDFTKLPLLSPDHRAGTLEATYARLRARWQDMTDEMKRLEEENNRIFIGAYGLQDELTPEVPIEEITLSCNPAYRYGSKSSPEELEARLLADTIAEFLHYAVGCMFGRYSLDAPGLILANQGETLADYLARIPEPAFELDADNVIPVLDGDWFADDIVERFRKFLRVAFGEEKFQENLSFIESALGKDIRKWFTRDFYDYHVRRFKKRPIYWMFASPKGSFQALIYMHRYRPDTVSVLLNDYLREYRNKLEAHRKSLESLSSSANASPAQRTKAEKEIGEVTKVIAELDAYERDVLFPLATQKIEINLDDGVKANYPKFGDALRPIKGLSDADA